MATRSCTKCLESKPIGEFYLNCYGRNGACKACVAAKNREYYQAKKQRIAERHAERRAQGEKQDVGAVQRRRDTPHAQRYAERREKVNENKRDRHRTNAQFRAVVYVETKLRRALADQGPKLEALVGCSSQWFQDWIEYQLTDGMTPDNYGVAWSYDHVIPKSAFDFRDSEQVKQCNHWSNWCPVSVSKNSSKNSARDPALEESHAMLAYIFQIIQDAWLLHGNNAQD